MIDDEEHEEIATYSDGYQLLVFDYETPRCLVYVELRDVTERPYWCFRRVVEGVDVELLSDAIDGDFKNSKHHINLGSLEL